MGPGSFQLAGNMNTDAVSAHHRLLDRHLSFLMGDTWELEGPGPRQLTLCSLYKKKASNYFPSDLMAGLIKMEIWESSLSQHSGALDPDR